MSAQNNDTFLPENCSIGAPVRSQFGITSSPVLDESGNPVYFLKSISVPQSQTQLDALLITGAYPDAAAAKGYFQTQATELAEEAEQLSQTDGFVPFLSWNVTPDGEQLPGYHVSLLSPYQSSLEQAIARREITYLDAVNLGIDMCTALSACRKNGRLCINLKPSNIFLSDTSYYRIGDLGTVPLDALQYQYVPEKYQSPYTPPELTENLTNVNETADTYALGMILYQLFNNGNLPEEPKKLPIPANGDIQIRRILMKACHPDPDKRWKSPEQMGQVLVLYMQRNTINATPLLAPLSEAKEEAPEAETAPEEPGVSDMEPIPEVVSEVQAADAQIPEEPEQVEEPIPQEPQEPELLSPEAEETESEIVEAAEEAAVSAEPEPEEPDLSPAEPETDSSIASDFDEIFAPSSEGTEFDFESELADVASLLENTPKPPPKTPPKPLKKAKHTKPSTSEYKPGRRKARAVLRFFLTVLIVFCLAVVGFAGYVYYQNAYLQAIGDLTASSSPSSLTVVVDSDAADSLLTLVCTNPYGHSIEQPVENGTAVFQDLVPGTMYSIRAEISGFHKLTGETTIFVTTPSATNVASLTVVPGQDDGSAIVSLSVSGAEPESWELTIAADGEEPRIEVFSGHTVTVSDLALDTAYRFALAAADDTPLVGQLETSYTAEKSIMARGLTVTSAADGMLTLTWVSEADTTWQAHCYGDGFDQSLETDRAEVTFSGIDSEKSYTVEVIADGMTVGSKLTIPANPISILSPFVDDSAVSAISISWEHTGSVTESWLLTYSIDGSQPVSVLTDIPFISISPKVPGAVYHFMIQTSDNAFVLGGEFDYTCPAAKDFVKHSISSYALNARLLPTPETAKWSFMSNTDSDYTTEFTPSQNMSMVLHGTANFYLDDEDVEITFLVRNAEGNVLTELSSSRRANWAHIWSGYDYHYAELDIGPAPAAAGSYTLELYLDGMLAVKNSFQVI